MNDIGTTNEVAKYCRVSEAEVLRWVKTGLPYLDLGKGFRFRKSDVDAFIMKFRKVAV